MPAGISRHQSRTRERIEITIALEIPSPLRLLRRYSLDELAIPPLKLLLPSLEGGTPPLPPSFVREVCDHAASSSSV
jgi:hypothetical protein